MLQVGLMYIGENNWWWWWLVSIVGFVKVTG